MTNEQVKEMNKNRKYFVKMCINSTGERKNDFRIRIQTLDMVMQQLGYTWTNDCGYKNK